ncbi:MAG: hypothetical protein ABI640_21855 [Gammaproteobacteria bacterium]
MSAKDRLSRNMASLSYGLGAAADQADKAQRTASIDIRRPYASGATDARRTDTQLGSMADVQAHGPIYQKGTPLKNIGQFFAGQVGIPTKRYWGQRAEEADAASAQLADERTAQDANHSQALGNIQRLGGMTQNPDEREQLAQAAAALNKSDWQYKNFRDPGQRAAAMAEHARIADEVGTRANDRMKEQIGFARQYVGQELKDWRGAVKSVDSGKYQSDLALNSNLAKLDEVDENTVEGQAVLRETLSAASRQYESAGAAVLQAAGGVAGMAPGPYAAGFGALASAAGAYLAKEDRKLSKDAVIKLMLKANDAADKLTEQFRGQLANSGQGIAQRAQQLGIDSGESWRTELYKLDQPYTDYFRGKYFPNGAKPGTQGVGGTPLEPPGAAPAERLSLERDHGLPQPLPNESNDDYVNRMLNGLDDASRMTAPPARRPTR